MPQCRSTTFSINGKLRPALGGVLVAAMVLAPESFGAVRAALANQLQRSVNILLGSVLASIGLTIPAVLTIGFLRGSTIILGLDEVDTTLLLLTVVLSMLTLRRAAPARPARSRPPAAVSGLSCIREVGTVDGVD
ncbi:MAG: hypothetical protein U0231_18145 [Nitrospiraceae bacterium]